MKHEATLISIGRQLVEGMFQLTQAHRRLIELTNSRDDWTFEQLGSLAMVESEVRRSISLAMNAVIKNVEAIGSLEETKKDWE